jgi:hypothetical protein
MALTNEGPPHAWQASKEQQNAWRESKQEQFDNNYRL